MTDSPVIALWSPCCGWVRLGEHDPGSMHSGLCRSRPGHDGKLGPTIRLVVHPHDFDALVAYRTLQELEG